MQLERFWLVCCLSLMILIPPADGKVSPEPRLRQILPADAVGYIRIPDLWGFMSKPKGDVLNDVLKDEDHVRMIDALKQSMGSRFLDLADPQWAPLIELGVLKLASPIEMALEIPENGSPQMGTLLMSARLSIDSLEGFRTFLTGLVEKSSELTLMGPVSPEGYATLGTNGLPVFLHYDPEGTSLTAMAGMTVNEAAFKERIAGLAPVEAHPMYPFENRIDESRQGVFAWINVAKIMPFMTGSMTHPDLDVMKKWGLTTIRGIALGWGVSKGKGRLELSIDAPKAGYRTLFPDIENDFDLWASGVPETVFTVSLPLRRIADALNTIGEKEGIPELPAALRRLDAVCREHVKMSLADVLDAVGPEMVVFTDKIDTFVAVEIGNREKLDRLLETISDRPNASLAIHERDGKRFRHLSLPSMWSQVDDAERTDPAERLMFGILNAVKTHLFWTEDDGYLVFASAPQVLFDRADSQERVSIGPWIDGTHDARHAVINLSTRLSGTPSKIYSAYLQWITLLGDIAERPVDLFSLPSAREADLPTEGAYGFQFTWADPVVSLSFTFENNPLEFLMAQDASATVAAAGVLAAIAIPNFIEYRTRSYDAAANADIKNAYTAAQAYFTDYPAATVTMENLKEVGYYPTEGVVLTIEDGGWDTLKITSYHEKGKTVYTVDAMGSIASFPK